MKRRGHYGGRAMRLKRGYHVWNGKRKEKAVTGLTKARACWARTVWSGPARDSVSSPNLGERARRGFGAASSLDWIDVVKSSRRRLPLPLQCEAVSLMMNSASHWLPLPSGHVSHRARATSVFINCTETAYPAASTALRL